MRLQAGEHFAERDRRRVCAHRVEHFHEDVGARHAYFEAAHVIRRVDRTARIVDRAHAGIVECQANEAAALERLQNLAPDRAVADATHVRFVAERVGQGERLRRREHVVDGAEIDARDVQHLEAREIDGVRLRAELA